MIVDSFRIRSRGHLLRHIVLFTRLLRLVGVPATPHQLLDLVKALPLLDLQCRQEVKDAVRAMLVTSREQVMLFDSAFDLFWQAWTTDEQPADTGNMQKEPLAEGGSDVRNQERERVPETDPGDDIQTEPESETLAAYSAEEVLRHKDFAELTETEAQTVFQLIHQSRWQPEQHAARRKRPAAHGTHPDLRRVLRQGLHYGGEVMKFAWQTPKQKRRPLIVLCDISGSMERYVRFLLRFLYVVTNGLGNAEVFVFGTRLTRLTRPLRQSDMDMALHQAAEVVSDWGGGTRIGEALKAFNFEWARRVMSHGPTVLIISDGWDRGDLDLLRGEMLRLQLNCRRLIWLNPLLGAADYEPLAQGIQTALPFVDDFLPVHNLASLEQLTAHLEQITHRRAVGRCSHRNLTVSCCEELGKR
jgi:uncharacterized protein with von Willebrand factor type A (vWA) domain